MSVSAMGIFRFFVCLFLLFLCSASFAVDTDGDGIDDSIDNCPFIVNSDQANFDEDSLGDNCDLDDDNDRVVDQNDHDPKNPTIIYSSYVLEREYNDEREFSTPFDYVAFGGLSGINDVDWFKVYVSETDTTGTFSVAFDTSLIEHSPTPAFFSVWWYAPDMSVRSGRNISSDDDLFLYTFPAFVPGYYFLRVQYDMGASYFYSGGTYRVLAKAESFVTTSEICDGMDLNSDGIFDSDVCDSDGDGVTDSIDDYPVNEEYSDDTDNDGMPDEWEVLYGLDPNDASDATSDQDNDGSVALQEFIEGTIPDSEVSLNQISWDFDEDGNVDALTDGLLLLRYTFNLTGSALTDSAISQASSLTPEQVQDNVAAATASYADIDGNGNVDALTDGLILLRYLFNLTGDALIDSAVAGDATRTTAADIQAYINTYIPVQASADSDDDGVADDLDAFPLDASEWSDTDGDGVGDNADDLNNDFLYFTLTGGSAVVINNVVSRNGTYSMRLTNNTGKDLILNRVIFFEGDGSISASANGVDLVVNGIHPDGQFLDITYTAGIYGALLPLTVNYIYEYQGDNFVKTFTVAEAF